MPGCWKFELLHPNIYIYIFTRGDFFVKIIAWILDHGADIHKLLKVGLVGLCYQAQQQSILP